MFNGVLLAYLIRGFINSEILHIKVPVSPSKSRNTTSKENLGSVDLPDQRGRSVFCQAIRVLPLRALPGEDSHLIQHLL